MAFARQARRLGAMAMALVIGLSAVGAWAYGAESLYRKGKARLDSGRNDIALLYFRELLRDYPDSSYADEAHFLVASYYMESRDYFQAGSELHEHLRCYPDSPYTDEVLRMLARIEVVDLEAKANRAMAGSEYRVAKVLWEDVLVQSPDHAVAARKLAECERILKRMDYQRRQLDLAKERIEAESREIAKLLDESRRQRAEAERIRAEAEEMDEKTRLKYDAALAEANRLGEELQERIEDLETDLKLWRDRARQYEARLLTAPDIAPIEGLTAAQGFPKIIFEGPETDPSPEPGEQQVVGLLLKASPSAVLVGEFMNRETNVLKAEVVVGVDLNKPWPTGAFHRVKVRVDFTAIEGDSDVAAPIPPKTVYYTLADMDEVDTRNRAYRKKLIIAMDKNTIDTYSVAAYFIKKTKP